jgi:purine nucleoside phosphorylase
MKLGVVGGSSLVTFDPEKTFGVIGLEVVSEKDIVAKTSHGDVKLRQFDLAGGGVSHSIIFIQRHSHTGQLGIKHGITPPHKINHKANMKALADQGVDAIVATASVGTLINCTLHCTETAHL